MRIEMHDMNVQKRINRFNLGPVNKTFPDNVKPDRSSKITGMPTKEESGQVNICSNIQF